MKRGRNQGAYWEENEQRVELPTSRLSGTRIEGKRKCRRNINKSNCKVGTWEDAKCQTRDEGEGGE